ncbi:hypothetical protein PMYN1_Chma608 (chromatophore) [Paulinella micropora]|uniref:YGGT family, conserved hypothetical integral membrane protein n=1 Tax=Paulinella micropora TaxID=1928728 RepID=A0A1L5YCL2_9EUKA|nr:YGGT family, conserved hypothetical integral membrane protein [Paulinella micropora]AQX45195.1 YGGT family, conserved hypothetical integral membrane protein [Paulinella micropora]BBL86413.1 hypothetical protein PMYN1_Chma608 [Paulinella micropora]
MTGFDLYLQAIHLILKLLLNCWTLLFLFRIVFTWYPQVALDQGIAILLSGPTEPFLRLTRSLLVPLGGIDITPVVWVGISSLLRELLVGQQGLLTQVIIYYLRK